MLKNRPTVLLLSRLPMKYQNRVYGLDREDGLVDGCKYMLYFNTGVNFGGYTSIPVKSVTEAIYYVKNSDLN